MKRRFRRKQPNTPAQSNPEPGEPVYISLGEQEAVGVGIQWLDQRADEHLAAGMGTEAAREYEDDIETCRKVIAAAADGGAPATPEMARAIDNRISHALQRLGVIEAMRESRRPSTAPMRRRVFAGGTTMRPPIRVPAIVSPKHCPHSPWRARAAECSCPRRPRPSLKRPRSCSPWCPAIPARTTRHTRIGAS